MCVFALYIAQMILCTNWASISDRLVYIDHYWHEEKIVLGILKSVFIVNLNGWPGTKKQNAAK